MNFKQIIILVLFCIIGAFFNEYIPREYKYIFGYIMGTATQTILHCLED